MLHGIACDMLLLHFFRLLYNSYVYIRESSFQSIEKISGNQF